MISAVTRTDKTQSCVNSAEDERHDVDDSYKTDANVFGEKFLKIPVALIREIGPSVIVLSAVSSLIPSSSHCFASLGVIADRSGLSLRQASRHLKSLVENGYLRKWSTDERSSKSYQLTPKASKHFVCGAFLPFPRAHVKNLRWYELLALAEIMRRSVKSDSGYAEYRSVSEFCRRTGQDPKRSKDLQFAVNALINDGLIDCVLNPHSGCTAAFCLTDKTSSQSSEASEASAVTPASPKTSCCLSENVSLALRKRPPTDSENVSQVSKNVQHNRVLIDHYLNRDLEEIIEEKTTDVVKNSHTLKENSSLRDWILKQPSIRSKIQARAKEKEPAPSKPRSEQSEPASPTKPDDAHPQVVEFDVSHVIDTLWKLRRECAAKAGPGELALLADELQSWLWTIRPPRSVTNPRKPFKPPEVEEVAEYCSSRNNNVDPEAFVSFYQSKGWKVGSQAMKDWKAAVLTWEKRSKSGPTPVSRQTVAEYNKAAFDEVFGPSEGVSIEMSDYFQFSCDEFN